MTWLEPRINGRRRRYLESLSLCHTPSKRWLRERDTSRLRVIARNSMQGEENDEEAAKVHETRHRIRR